MPGFSIGGSGNGPPNTQDTLRVYRWLITQLGPITSREQLRVAKEITLPNVNIDKQDILGGTLYYKYAKAVKWEDVMVTLYDTGQTLFQLESWKDLVYSNASGIKNHNPNSGYKKEAVFELMDGEGSVVNTVRLKNAWPTKIVHGRLTYAASDIKVIQVVLVYDWAEVS
jgi:hypothetical protein